MNYDPWNYEYGGVQKRTIWSKTKLILNATWFIPYLLVGLAWYFVRERLTNKS
jgi:hypothetical protein